MFLLFLKSAHKKLDVYKISQDLILECYKTRKHFPDSEKFVFVQQIRRVAISVHQNIGEGCSRKSIAERKRFFEIAGGSVI